MSRKLFSRNEDLQRLRADGYYVQIVDEKFLVIRQCPTSTNDARSRSGPW
jgi:biotin operon repressor